MSCTHITKFHSISSLPNHNVITGFCSNLSPLMGLARVWILHSGLTSQLTLERRRKGTRTLCPSPKRPPAKTFQICELPRQLQVWAEHMQMSESFCVNMPLYLLMSYVYINHHRIQECGFSNSSDNLGGQHLALSRGRITTAKSRMGSTA